MVRPTDNPAFTAAHCRLFDHLCETTEPRPDTLEGLQPLYQAVTHGCLAGRQPEACDKVLYDRIWRRDFYSRNKLGAIGPDLGAVALFFESPWRRLFSNLSEAAQARLLNEAAFSLRALGRLTEAREPMRGTLEINVKAGQWENAAVVASNLSELEVTLGRLDDAVADARVALDYADRSCYPAWVMVCRTTLADALQVRRTDLAEARTLFEDAERRQAEWQPQFPLLYSLRGFQYADLILAPAECAAWQALLRGTGCQPVRSDDEHGLEARATALAACTEATRRATQTQKWALSVSNASLLDIALDHLTLARAELYRAIFAASCEALTEAATQLPQALDGLRKASALNHLPKALLTSAWLAGVSGSAGWETAAVDLAEAEEIARRGPMPLYLADVLLTRARLAHVFPDRWPGCDPRTELNAARELIEKHNYGRRTEELADAQAAIDAGKL